MDDIRIELSSDLVDRFGAENAESDFCDGQDAVFARNETGPIRSFVLPTTTGCAGTDAVERVFFLLESGAEAPLSSVCRDPHELFHGVGRK